MELKKIDELSVREITLIDMGITAVAGLNFPVKTKYKMGKIQNQISKVLQGVKEARTGVTETAIEKFKLKKGEDGNYVYTDVASMYVEREITKILDQTEKITGGLYPFTLKEMEEAEEWTKEWNEDIKAKDQPSVAIPNSFYTALFPIIIDNGKEEKKK